MLWIVDTTEQPRRRRLTQAERRARSRRDILSAAWELFAEQGYADTTIEQVAERAGYSRTPVRDHFGSKAGLFFALWMERVRRYARPLSELVAPDTRLVDWVTSAAGRARHEQRLTDPEARLDAELTATMYAVLLRHDDLREAFELELSESLGRTERELTRRMEETGEQFPLAPHKLAILLSAVQHGLTSLALYDGFDVTPEDLATAQLAILKATPPA